MAINFNLDKIPANANIASASLSFYFYDGDTNHTNPADLCSLFTMRKAWKATEATWTKASNAVQWEDLDADTKFYRPNQKDTVKTPGGGDRHPAAIASVSPVTFERWEEYSITNTMKEAIRNKSTFYGFYHKPYLGNKGRFYASSEYTDATKRPKLVVKYASTGIVIGKKQHNSARLFTILPTTSGLNVRSEITGQWTMTFHTLDGTEVARCSEIGKRAFTLSRRTIPAGVIVVKMQSREASGSRSILLIP